MRRLDGIERIAAEAYGRPHADDVAWLIARIRRLEAALRAARLSADTHFTGQAGYEGAAGFMMDFVELPLREHQRAIDAALKEDP
mgnify:CR=1 FL=1